MTQVASETLVHGFDSYELGAAGIDFGGQTISKIRGADGGSQMVGQAKDLAFADGASFQNHAPNAHRNLMLNWVKADVRFFEVEAIDALGEVDHFKTIMIAGGIHGESLNIARGEALQRVGHRLSRDYAFKLEERELEVGWELS